MIWNRSLVFEEDVTIIYLQICQLDLASCFKIIDLGSQGNNSNKN